MDLPTQIMYIHSPRVSNIQKEKNDNYFRFYPQTRDTGRFRMWDLLYKYLGVESEFLVTSPYDVDSTVPLLIRCQKNFNVMFPWFKV